ncbi:MAG: hypothetical protein B7Y45_04015 [Sphingomonas sp. 28-66-16]|nr:MAG: hypothetical protein B7Y45_04015 [Sphingomonas sp. 28-66-16]
MKRIFGAMLLVAPALGGCLPLEQAPLVYSSTQQMGVSVSAGKPENPAPSIVVGYNGVDVAYVPVAVAKRCDTKSGADCSAIDYNIRTILGGNKVVDQSSNDDDIIKERRAKIRKLEEYADATAPLINAKKAQLDEIDSLQSLKERKQFLDDKANAVPLVEPSAAATTPAPPALTNDEIKERATLAAKIARIAPLVATRADLQADLDALERKLTQNATEIDRNQLVLNALIEARRNQQKADDTADSLSVYGSFNGNASGTKDGAGLSLGKVFSTGVAAQFIAAGARDSAPSIAKAQCIHSVQELIVTAKPTATSAGIDALLGICKTEAKATTSSNPPPQ